MAHSKSKNWIHLTFCTKYRLPIITATVEPIIHGMLRQELVKMHCQVNSINGTADHVHVLFLLTPQKSLSEVVKQIKGASSHAINQSGLLPDGFAWSVGYGAFSVSESAVKSVRAYILNQKKHHNIRDSEQEYRDFLRLHGLAGE